MDPVPAFIIKIGQDPPVSSQQSMNVSDKIIDITVQPVVVVVPALIRTEFLIGTAFNNIAAIETFFFHSTLMF